MHLSSLSLVFPKLRISLKSVYETFPENEQLKSMTSKIHLEILQGKSLIFDVRLSFRWKFMLNATQWFSSYSLFFDVK